MCLNYPSFNPTVISLCGRLDTQTAACMGEILKCCVLCCICRDAHVSAVSKAVEPACFTGKLNPREQEAYKRMVSSCYSAGTWRAAKFSELLPAEDVCFPCF